MLFFAEYMLLLHGQARGADLTEPYVIFPHWNHDELLIPAYEALRALQGDVTLYNGATQQQLTCNKFKSAQWFNCCARNMKFIKSFCQ